MDKDREILADAIRNPAKYGVTGCALCGRKIRTIALFTPTEAFAKRIGQPEGKQRVVVYGLCSPCSRLQDLASRVERAMLRDMGVQ